MVPPALQERIARLEAQCRAKHDAAESSIEERLRDKEAIEAENAAAAARLQENEATVGGPGGGGAGRVWNGQAGLPTVAPLAGCWRPTRRWPACLGLCLGCRSAHLLLPRPGTVGNTPARPLPAPCSQMRKLQERIAELQEAHSAQIAAVMGQYDALLRQVRAGVWVGWGAGVCEVGTARVGRGVVVLGLGALCASASLSTILHSLTHTHTHTMLAARTPGVPQLRPAVLCCGHALQVGEYHRGMEAAMQPAAPSDVAVKPMRVR